METAVDATGICNDLSICTMEMSNIIQWLEACYKSGYLTDEQTGLDISKLGTREFFENLANMIARREGFGDILAEGLLRAGEKLGERARVHFSDEVSGVGAGASYSAREYLMNGLLYALEPRQPIAMSSACLCSDISWIPLIKCMGIPCSSNMSTIFTSAHIMLPSFRT